MSKEKTNPETIKKCRTVTLNDVPEKKDAFDGPHEKVATAIHNILSSKDEPGGKMIGLEGGWGSGKSTVVALIQDKLVDNKDVAVFYFDTWAHEGDPLRRTFLESLIVFFRDKSWVDKTYWKEKLEFLSKRRRISSSRSVPKPTKLGLLIALAALFVPIGAPFVAGTLKNGVTIDNKLPIYWQFVMGIIFVCMPILVVIGNAINMAIVWLRKSEEQKKKEKSEKLDPKAAPKPSSWAFWAGTSITEVYNDTTETPEPTSIEFENTFKELMSSALPGESNKRVVIILDNLDRVDADYALGIWSTLQTFLQQRHYKEEDWFKKLWILVPYDRKGLSNLWAKDENPSVANSFIDKSFQLRFEVPPMILSNWKKYLISLLKKALPDHSDVDFNQIYRVYNLCSIHFKEAPTPRQLKIFTNDMGSIHRQWEDQFPLSHVAYYVVLKKQKSSIIEQIIEWSDISQKMEAFLGAGLKESLAGLAYNVEGSTGLQIVLKNPVRDALASNKPEELKELLDKHKGGFWVVFEEIITVDIADFDTITLANLASSIVTSEILNGKPQHEIDEIKSRIRKVVEIQKDWGIYTNELSSGLQALTTLISDQNFTSTMFKKARNTVKTANTTEVPIANESFIENLSNVLKYAKSNGLSEVLKEQFELPLEIEPWIDTCPIIQNKCEPDLWKNIYPKETSDQFTLFLANTIAGGSFLDKHIAAIEVSGNSYDSVNWQPVIIAIEARMDVNHSLQNKEVDLLIRALHCIKRFDNKTGKTSLKKLINNGEILHWLYQAHSQNQNEYIAWPIISYLEQSPGASIAPNVGNSLAGKNIIDEYLAKDDDQLASSMLEILSKLGSYKILFDVIEVRTKDRLTFRCLVLAMEEKYYDVVYTSQAIMDNWYFIYQNIIEFGSDEVYDNLIQMLSEKTKLIPDIEVNVDGFNIYDSGLYADIVRLHESNSFQNWCIAGLQNAPSNEWLEAFIESYGSLSLLLALKDRNCKINLATPYVDAHELYAKKILDGGLSKELDDVYKENWVKLLEGIDENSIRNNLRRKLLEAVIKNHEKKINDFIELYGLELIHSDMLKQKSSEIIDKIFSKVINDRSQVGLNWLKNLIQVHPKFIEECDDKVSVDPFISRFKDELKNEDSSQEFVTVKEISELFKIKPDPIEELETEPDPESPESDESPKE